MSMKAITSKQLDLLRAVLPRSEQVCVAGSKTTARDSKDRSHFDPSEPDVVVLASSTEDVSDTMKFCNSEQIPVTVRGTGTGLEGGSLATCGGVLLDLGQMNKVLHLNQEELLCTLQPGVFKNDFNKYLKPYGLFFGVDPGSNACVGGYASTGASGTLSVKYGTMRENVTSLKVVLTDGTVIDTRRPRVVKSSVGYNLTQLFIGSEGTLGVITELTVKVQQEPKFVVSALALFTELRAACSMVAKLVKAQIKSVARAELLNTESVCVVNKYSGTSLRATPTVLLDFYGSTLEEVTSASNIAKTIAETCGSIQWQECTEPEAREELWAARRDVYYASFGAREDTGKGRIEVFVTDVCVPLPNLVQAITETEADFARTTTIFPCIIVGHVMDGNFHCLIPYKAHDKEEEEIVVGLNSRLLKRALALEGTCSGEHGVGIGKKEGLLMEHGQDNVRVMQAIKRALDPKGILNVGKLFDSPYSGTSKL